jgi:hypothetical protein
MLTTGHDWGDDFSSYIMQAKSVAEGDPRRFIEENRFTIEESSYPLGPVAYPWGTPVLLAPIYRMMGLDLVALKMINVLAFVLFLTTLSLCLFNRHIFVYIFLIISLFALNPCVLELLNHILSDIPFLLFSTVSILFMGRSIIDRRFLISCTVDNIFLGILLAVSFFIRTNGILLLFTLVGTQLISVVLQILANRTTGYNVSMSTYRFLSCALCSDRKTIYINIVPYITFVALTLILAIILPQDTESHLSYFKELSLASIKDHLLYYAELPAHFFRAVPHYDVLYGATLPFVLAGMVNGANRDYHMLLYIFLTVLLYVCWPPIQGLRFLLPILPFFIHFMFVGLHRLCTVSRNAQASFIHLLTLSLLCLVVICFLGVSINRASSNMSKHRVIQNGPFEQTSQDMFYFIKEHVPEDAVIVFFKPRLMRMLTNRRSIMVSKVSDLNKGNYLCIYLGEDAYDQLPYNIISSLVNKGTLDPIYVNRHFAIYQIGKTLLIE